MLVDGRKINGFSQAGVLAGEHSPGKGLRCWGPRKGDMMCRRGESGWWWGPKAAWCLYYKVNLALMWVELTYN